jgi:hypothetical protein
MLDNPLEGLPTAADYLQKRYEEDKKIYKLGEVVWKELNKLSEEAELYRIDYDKRVQEHASAESFGYWKGRRDEAGHFRDRLIALMESLGR